MTNINFEILLDELFLSPNNRILSLINDFEDGKWRYEKFKRFIWDNIIETALSKDERDSTIGGYSQLSEAAKKLRFASQNDFGIGSELAEIVLYGIMKNQYSALPVVPKIFYKQNTQDNVKGADSVHIVINKENNDFSVWFGEAKFYNSIENARLYGIVKSVGKSLDSKKLKKENSIITSVSDIDKYNDINDSIKGKIKQVLSNNNSIDNMKKYLHIPILLLYECQITREESKLTDDYKSKIINYHKNRADVYFTKQIEKLKNTIHCYEEITFHLILFPVPCKSYITEDFLSQANIYR